MRSTRLVATLSVLALGTALSALPALAQDYHVGRTANDGGPLTTQDQKQAQNQGQNQGQRTGARSNASAQNNAQSAQENSRNTMRERQAMSENSTANSTASGERSRPRVTRRMTVIRMRPARRNEATARGEDYENLRAGPGNVAETTAPPQRQSFGHNGPAGGNGDRFYDQYRESGREGFGPNPGIRPTAMD